MGYRVTDMISGRPQSCEPAIRTAAKKRTRALHRARSIVVVPAGSEASVLDCHLFRPDHAMRARIYDEPRIVDIYRTRSRGGHLAGVESYPWPAEMLPVADDEVEWLLNAQDQRLRMIVELYFDKPDQDIRLRDLVRQERGDLLTLRWLQDSPYMLSEDEAFDRGDDHLTTEHLYCGVREVHHRWEFYRGLGGHLVVEGAADTRQEAEVLAQAYLWHAWLRRVEEIRERRLGDLSWGNPIGCPFLKPAEVGDPQAEYTRPPEGGRNV